MYVQAEHVSLFHLGGKAFCEQLGEGGADLLGLEVEAAAKLLVLILDIPERTNVDGIRRQNKKTSRLTPRAAAGVNKKQRDSSNVESPMQPRTPIYTGGAREPSRTSRFVGVSHKASKVHIHTYVRRWMHVPVLLLR